MEVWRYDEVMFVLEDAAGGVLMSEQLEASPPTLEKVVWQKLY